ncbi:MAG: DUF4373 domain-containing protein [Oscillospiraceae bacterium]
MGRPIKKGLSYFPLDVTVFSDIKIMFLTEEYGADGFCTFITLLSMIYANGYYIEEPIEFVALVIKKKIGSKWKKSISDVVEMIRCCGELDLLDKKLMKKNVFTSRGIQEQYDFITTRNKPDKSKYWLLDDDDEADDDDCEEEKTAVEVPSKTDKSNYKVGLNNNCSESQNEGGEKSSVSDEDTFVSAAKTDLSDEDTEDNAEKMQQKKENKSKVNKSKVNCCPTVTYSEPPPITTWSDNNDNNNDEYYLKQKEEYYLAAKKAGALMRLNKYFPQFGDRE